MIARIIDWSARHRWLVILVYLGVILAAREAIRKVPLDAIPDLSDPQVIVFTEWRGRSPTLMEDQVTFPISAALLSAPRVTAVRGFSMFGMSFVYALFEDGTDPYWARSRVLEYLNGIQGRLPAGVTPALGPDATGVGWVYSYALVDKSAQLDLSELRSLQDYTLRPALESVSGVAQVASVGGYERQYQVLLDPERMRGYDVTVSDVADAVRQSTGEIGARSLELSGREYAVRGRAQLKSLDQLGDTVIRAGPTGTPVRVRDVGGVRIGGDVRRGLAELDGQGEVVGAIVIARYGENALGVIERVERKLESLRGSLPKGVEVVPTYDRSGLIERAMSTLKSALVEEMIVVSLVILIFLLHLRSAALPIISLPLAVATAFIPMWLFGVPATIMSLGGIAIAIGATVDAEIVMIEACHKKLEHAPPNLSPLERAKLLAEAAKEVTPAIFFSLLIIAASFIPVFGLNEQAGRLFRPLAFTKTFVMLSAALLSITLAPALRDLLLRGRIRSEAQHPISRAIIHVYEPFVRIALRKPLTTLSIGFFAVLSTIPIFLRLGSEFMPPLNEGDLLYMPTTMPSISIEEAKRQLELQDSVLRKFPEVKRVFGKVGRAETPTDPAPLSMVETVVELHPPAAWPQQKVTRFFADWPRPLRTVLGVLWPEQRPETWQELVQKLNASLQFPGWTNAFTMPIKTRIDMLTTGVRTPVGVKVLGSDLAAIERTGAQLEATLREVPGVRSVIYERSLGGSYLDITPRREALARYALPVQKLLDDIETAVGGEPVATTLDGRRRLSISVRFTEDFRATPEAIKLLPVRAPDGAYLQLGDLADVAISEGPPMLRSEAGMLAGYVYVDIDEQRDLASLVEDAQRAVERARASGRIKLQAGQYLVWTGQYEQLSLMRERMKLLVPLALGIVLLLLYAQFRNLTEVAIVMLSIPFALVGSFWLLYLLDYRLSTAVWVGIIALVGLATQTGVVMIVYIDQAFERRLRRDAIHSLEDIIDAHSEGTVQRVRPKLMTVATMLLGLLPLLWATGSGADVMKRIAAPMVGGLVSSAFLTLELIPVVYTYWRYAQLRKAQRLQVPLARLLDLQDSPKV
jgi:Cu(I)/Ag(I) efflux system membrane protein CusA/SilA